MSYALAQKSTITLSCWNRPKPIFAGDVAMAEPANVGGETANAVGEKMKQIAANRQVFCITHLPQVAAPADAHYVVTKQVVNGRTVSEIKLLDQKSRITELARMLGGQSDAARKHAEALLK